jgi:hypothetical protein
MRPVAMIAAVPTASVTTFKGLCDGASSRMVKPDNGARFIPRFSISVRLRNSEFLQRSLAVAKGA